MSKIRNRWTNSFSQRIGNCFSSSNHDQTAYFSRYCSCLLLVAGSAKADETDLYRQPIGAPSRKILTQAQWTRVDQSIERGLEYLISQQGADGSFQTKTDGQPGVTSLCVMGFLANGCLPGEGKYGDELSRSVKFILLHQTESGVIASAHPDGPKISRDFAHHVGKTVAYNHAISSLLLSEI